MPRAQVRVIGTIFEQIKKSLVSRAPGAASNDDSGAAEPPAAPPVATPATFPSSLDCEIMMKTFSKCFDSISGKRLYEQMVQAGVQPTDVTYSAYVFAIAKAGNMMEGLRLADEVRRNGGNYASVFCTLISGLVNARFAYSGVESVFERALASNAHIDTRCISSLVRRATSIFFSALVSIAYAHHSRTLLILIPLHRVYSRGSRPIKFANAMCDLDHSLSLPSPALTTALLMIAQTMNAARSGRFERARELIELMKRNWKNECAAAAAAQRAPSDDLKPSVYPYSIFISHASKRLSNTTDSQERETIEKLSESDAIALQRLCDQVRAVLGCQSSQVAFYFFNRHTNGSSRLYSIFFPGCA